jgi:hypothetical protein
MTLEHLLLDPSFGALCACCFAVTSAFKKALAVKFPTGRQAASVRLLLIFFPLAVGAGLSPLFFGEVPVSEAALVGVFAALPAIAGYNALRRCAELPGLPPLIHTVLAAVLQASRSLSVESAERDENEESV